MVRVSPRGGDAPATAVALARVWVTKQNMTGMIARLEQSAWPRRQRRSSGSPLVPRPAHPPGRSLVDKLRPPTRVVRTWAEGAFGAGSADPTAVSRSCSKRCRLRGSGRPRGAATSGVYLIMVPDGEEIGGVSEARRAGIAVTMLRRRNEAHVVEIEPMVPIHRYTH